MAKELIYDTNEKGCMLVTSHCKNKQGYVIVMREGKTLFLHRYVYEKHNGSIPSGLLVRHKCDNPSCVNIEHLELGTHQDNMNDMVERGRVSTPETVGEKNGNAKINEDIVLEILKDKTSTNKALGIKYSIHHSTVSAIRKRKIWKHIQPV